jgi:hypothetical protein
MTTIRQGLLLILSPLAVIFMARGRRNSGNAVENNESSTNPTVAE